MSNLVALDATWFTPMGGPCIGIVKAKDTITGEIKQYIGVGEGENEKADIQRILERGAKFYGTPTSPNTV